MKHNDKGVAIVSFRWLLDSASSYTVLPMVGYVG